VACQIAERRGGSSRVAAPGGRAPSERRASHTTAPSPAADARPAPASSSRRRGRPGPGSAPLPAPRADRGSCPPAPLTTPAGIDRTPPRCRPPPPAAGLPSPRAVQPGTAGAAAPPGRGSPPPCRIRDVGQTTPSKPPCSCHLTPHMARMVVGPLYAALINARRAPGAGIAFVILTGNTTCPVTPACGPSDDTEKRHKPSPDRQRAQPAIPASVQHYSDAAPTQNRSSARLQSSSSDPIRAGPLPSSAR
jgi:hypothetical protein